MKTLIFFIAFLFIVFSCGFLYMQNKEQEQTLNFLQTKTYLHEREIIIFGQRLDKHQIGLIEIARFLEDKYE